MEHKAKDTFLKSIESLCAPHYELEHLTHCHLECGHLLAPSFNLQFSLCKTPLNRYDLASLTKALVTTPLVFWSLVKEGRDLSSTLGEWLGKASSGFTSKILEIPIAKLLSHRSGLPDWKCLWAECLDESYQGLEPRERLYFRINHLARNLLQTGKYVYSDIGFIVLGMSLEEKHGQTLDKLFRNLLSEMGLTNSTLSYNSEQIERQKSIPVGFCPVRGRSLVGEVHDENASVLNGVMGHAGLFGTIEDVSSFLASLTKTNWGKCLLKENQNLRNQTYQSMIGLMGWHQGSGDSSRGFAKGLSIGHLGFTGTAFWMEPESYHYGILLTNRIIHARISPWITRFRSQAFSLMDEYLGNSK
ncbi:MAG: serine hydrolase [Oligoflexales bacterium]|nr:serine hydrolase [Oligoflexales bacterium]